MRTLLGWLRAKGVVSKTPLHTLRKQFGSEIHARYGLLAASEQLRHGGVAVTARHYIENKSRSVLGLGHLLKRPERTIIAIGRGKGIVTYRREASRRKALGPISRPKHCRGSLVMGTQESESASSPS